MKFTSNRIDTAKKRTTGHNGNFNNREQKGTTLSAYIWELKDKGIAHEVTWSILATASGYGTTTKQCRLCSMECWIILFKEELATLEQEARHLLKLPTQTQGKADLEPKAWLKTFTFMERFPSVQFLCHSCLKPDESKFQKAFRFYSTERLSTSQIFLLH